MPGALLQQTYDSHQLGLHQLTGLLLRLVATRHWNGSTLRSAGRSMNCPGHN